MGYELSPAKGCGGGKALSEEEASDWMRRLAANAGSQCFEAVGVSVDDLRGVGWLNGVGRTAREGCVRPNMQVEADVQSVRGMMEHPLCLWIQVDVGGGEWAPCDTLAVVDDGYVAAGALGEVVGEADDAVAPAPPPVPPVALGIRDVAGGLGLPWDDTADDSESDVDMGTSPLAARAGRRLVQSGGGRAGPLVEPVVLFPAVPVLPSAVRSLPRAGTVPDSVDGGESDLDDGDESDEDPACGGGSRAGGCACSCATELGHLSGKIRKLEDMVGLLVASAGLAGWEETRRMENLKRKKRLEREVAERNHVRRVAAEKAVGEEKKRLARRDGQARRAEELQKSQEESARLLQEQRVAADAALVVSVEECVKATTPEELVPRAARVAEAAASVRRVEAIPSPVGEDVDVGGGWRVVGGSVVWKVEVVSRLGGPVGRARTAGLPGMVGKVQDLLRSGSLGWGVSAKVWNKHGSDEILWTVSGVEKATEDSVVLERLRVNVAAAVDATEVVDWWVESHLSRYVVVGGIPEENWAACGWDGVRRDNPDVAWGHRGPLVVFRAWKTVTVKLEVLDAAAVGAAVQSGVVVGARKFGAQLAITAGGRGMQRGPVPAEGGAHVRGYVASGVKCFGCGKAGHLRRDCRAGGGPGLVGRPPPRCWGCGGVGHGISFCPGRALPVTSTAGVPAPVAGTGTADGGVKRGGGPLDGAGLRSRPFGGGSVLNYLGGGARRVAAAPKGARA